MMISQNELVSYAFFIYRYKAIRGITEALNWRTLFWFGKTRHATSGTSCQSLPLLRVNLPAYLKSRSKPVILVPGPLLLRARLSPQFFLSTVGEFFPLNTDLSLCMYNVC